MKVEKIEEEMNLYKAHLAYLEKRLNEIQQKCDHQFYIGNQYYEKCIKCHKVNVLYY